MGSDTKTDAAARSIRPGPSDAEVRAASERAWGRRGRIQQILRDAGLAHKGKAGRVDPRDPEGTVRLAESPDLEGPEAVPRLRDLTLLHEAGHMAEKDSLHEMGGKVHAARKSFLGLGPKVQQAEMERLKKNPAYADRAFEEAVKQAEEYRRDRSGALGAVRKALDRVVGAPRDDETLSEFVLRRTGKREP